MRADQLILSLSISPGCSLSLLESDIRWDLKLTTFRLSSSFFLTSSGLEEHREQSHSNPKL